MVNYYWLGIRLPEYKMGREEVLLPGDMRPTIGNVTAWVGRSVRIGVASWNPSAIYLECPSADDNSEGCNARLAQFGGEAERLLENSRANGDSVLACVFTCDFCGDASLGVVTDFERIASPHFFRRGENGSWVGGDVPDSMNRQVDNLRNAIGTAVLKAYELPASTWGAGK